MSTDATLGSPSRDTPVWIHNASKWFGPVLGVNRVNLRIDGGIVALVGPNGAGKSTLLKLLTGQLRPSIGAIRIFGRSVRSPFARRRLGYSPDVDAFYEEMTGREFVRAMLQLSGYSRREAFARADRALDAVGMADGADGLRAGKRIRGGSKGMRQRIKLAQAIAHDPDLLILDEPLSGLDPVGRRDFCRLFAEQARRGATVLVSSHVMAEVRELADRVVLIANGRLASESTWSEVAANLGDKPQEVVVACDRPRDLAALAMQHSAVISVRVGEAAGDEEECVIATRDPGVVCDELAKWVDEQGIQVHRFQVAEKWSEALFGMVDGA